MVGAAHPTPPACKPQKSTGLFWPSQAPIRKLAPEKWPLRPGGFRLRGANARHTMVLIVGMESPAQPPVGLMTPTSSVWQERPEHMPNDSFQAKSKMEGVVYGLEGHAVRALSNAGYRVRFPGG
jgi:hypothetical protein